MKRPFEPPFVVATGNKNKLAELQTVAEQFQVELWSPAEAKAKLHLDDPPDVEENDPTYAGNALLKASAFAAWANMPALGDDSGLEVVALENRPGVLSARYAGVGASDADKIAKVLQELDEVLARNPDAGRRARFCCALALVTPAGEKLTAEANLPGEILQECRGTNGFGYDPIVYLDNLGKTFAEVDFATVCAKGFRALAAQQLFTKLRNQPPKRFRC